MSRSKLMIHAVDLHYRFPDVGHLRDLLVESEQEGSLASCARCERR